MKSLRLRPQQVGRGFMKIKGTDAPKGEKIFLNDFTHYLDQLLILKRRKLKTKKMNKKREWYPRNKLC